MSAPIIIKRGSEEFRTAVHGSEVRIGDRRVRFIRQADGSLRFPDRPGGSAWTLSTKGGISVFLDGHVYEFEIEREGGRRRAGGRHHGSLTAPMPATVRRIEVSLGQRVERGDTLIVLEAMKMELPVKAPGAGSVQSIHCHEGDLVQPGAPLIELDELG